MLALRAAWLAAGRVGCCCSNHFRRAAYCRHCGDRPFCWAGGLSGARGSEAAAKPAKLYQPEQCRRIGLGAADRLGQKTGGRIAAGLSENGILTYDSYYPFAEFGEAAEDPSYAWTRPYTLQFANGSAEVILHGFYAYRFYNYALIGEIVCAFLLFLLIVMLGIRSLIRYIRQLSSEIKILEGGGLDYSITIKGRNELAELAQGLDAMRQSFLAQTQQEKQLALASQRMITEMSHDLRTPLTSIMLYTGILLSGKYTGEAQMLEYIRKIDAKAKRLKHLSDHLLEYALVTGEEDIPPLETLPVHTVFYDMLSEAAAYLEQQGFHMQMELDWTEQQI